MEDIMKTAFSLVDYLRGAVPRHDCFGVIVALCHCKRQILENNEYPFVNNASDICRMYNNSCGAAAEDDHIRHYVNDLLNPYGHGHSFDRALVTAYNALPADADQLAEIILCIEMEEQFSYRQGPSSEMTPRSVSKLAAKVLDIRDGDRVGDFCTGTGSFLVEASAVANCDLVFGCDINSSAAAIAKIRAAALGPNVTVEQADMFHIEGSFDKCFANYPFGMNVNRFKEDVLRGLEAEGFKGLPRFSSSDWLFNLQLLAKLKEDGRAVGVMAGGSSFNGLDEKIRRYFLSNGWIEAVVAMPAGLFSPYTGISTTMIVLSRNNESVRMVDASEICHRGRRETCFNDEDIRKILGLLKSDVEGLSCSKSYDDLAGDGFILNPARYLAEEINVADGVSIESLSSRITRGSGMSKGQLEEFHSAHPTPNRYLMLQHIVDGEIDDDLPYLTEIDRTQKRYCIGNGDLLLSKIGPNFKVAVAEVADDETVLATGNLYIIQLDKNKVDPRYVKLYLETDQGIAQLRRACVGTTMPSIPTRAFADILVPLVSMDKQKEIIGKYEDLRQEIAVHKLAIERARGKMANLLDEK